MFTDNEVLLENAIRTGVYFHFLHPLERVIYTVNTLCNQIAERRLWEKFRSVIRENLERGEEKLYGINKLSLREMKEIAIEVLNRKEIREELENASVLRCLLCGKKLGRWYVTINDRRVESAKRDKKVSEDQTFFEGVIPSRVEDNEEYCYVLRGAVDYCEALVELIDHMVKEHGNDLGKKILGKEEWTEEELLGLVFRVVMESTEKLLAYEAFTYERIQRAGLFHALSIERRMVRRKANITPRWIQQAYVEKKDIREALLELGLFEEGYYDLEIVYRDAPSAEEVARYRECGHKESSSFEIRRRPSRQTIIWSKLQEIVESRTRGVPVKIRCEKCSRQSNNSYSSMEELVKHIVRHHPDVALGKENLKKIVTECTPIGWLYHARKGACRDIFAYLGPHYVDMLPPVNGKSCLRYGFLSQERSRVYELYIRSFRPYRKYLRREKC